jgi:predicted transcriptional regulator
VSVARSLIYSTSEDISVEMGKYDEAVYCILSEPVTPNEVAKKIGVTQKTAQRVLMHLALTREDIKYKNSGRIHIFWKERESQESEVGLGRPLEGW